jgi:hypothetical protein
MVSIMNIRKATVAPSDPGIYCGLSNEAYHAGPGISKSGLDLLAKSPAHYKAKYIDKLIASEETPAMFLGTAAHAAILEPEEYAKWIVWQKASRATKEGKASYAEAEARAVEAGVPVIDSASHALVTAMARSVYSHPVSEMLATGVPELSVYWMDEESGVFCRCRPDWLGPFGVVDIKTTDDASPRGFVNSAYKYRYFVQAAFYLDGLAANGIDAQNFVFAAVEKTPPYAVMGYHVPESMIQAGRSEYKRLLGIYSDCATAGVWPTYGNFAELELPAWAPERFLFPEDNANAS